MTFQVPPGAALAIGLAFAVAGGALLVFRRTVLGVILRSERRQSRVTGMRVRPRAEHAGLIAGSVAFVVIGVVLATVATIELTG